MWQVVQAIGHVTVYIDLFHAPSIHFNYPCFSKEFPYFYILCLPTYFWILSFSQIKYSHIVSV